MSSQKTTHVPIIHSIAPWKWTQHCWMLHFASVCTPCCMLLRAIGSSCEKFETGKTFSRNVRNNSQHFLHEAYYSTITQCCFVKIILSLHSFMNDAMLITWGRRANSWFRLQGGGTFVKMKKTERWKHFLTITEFLIKQLRHSIALGSSKQAANLSLPDNPVKNS